MRYIYLLSLFLLTACSGHTPPVRHEVKVTEDAFMHNVIFIGAPHVEHPRPGFGMSWALKSIWERNTRQFYHQLYIHLEYIGHRDMFNSAFDDTVAPMELIHIAHHPERCYTNRCDITEDMGVTLDDAMLRARRASGYRIQITSKESTAITFTLTPAYLGAQYDAIEKYLAAHP